jgi:5-methyltetrahydrofolate--homocysteine methyltransferase
MRKTKKQSRSEYDKYIEDNALPALERWLKRLEDESLIDPAVTYGYFPCGREGNSLIVFEADGISQLGRFNLPRQSAGKCLCISDFYKDLNDGKPTDFLPMQAVTMGERCSIFAQQLFQSDAYTDYLFFHGLTVQLSEALAEWSHARIRRECGFGAEEPQAINDLLAQRYRGCRFSFGYPACPNVGDSRQQLKWLNSDSIGLIMDSNDQLQPEQSTTALIALHSQAHYFST